MKLGTLNLKYYGTIVFPSRSGCIVSTVLVSLVLSRSNPVFVYVYEDTNLSGGKTKLQDGDCWDSSAGLGMG